MFRKLLARLLGGKRLERIEAEEAFEKEFGHPPLRTTSTQHIKRSVEARKLRQADVRARNIPTSGHRVNSGHSVRSAKNYRSSPVYWDAPTSRSHSNCGSCSRSCGNDSHHSSSSSDSGSSDSGSSSCD